MRIGSWFPGLALLAVLLTGCGGGGSGGGGSGGGGGGGGGISSSQSGLVDACGDTLSVARPLVGEGPKWHTAEVRRMALEAREQGLGYDFETRQFVAPVAPPSQVLVRPGTQLFPESIFPGWCTAAFVFDGRSRIATAGHCTRAGDLVIALTAPTTIFVIGTTTTSVDDGPGNDWALVTIDPTWRPFVAPDAAFVGGPCGATTPGGVLPRLIKYVGHGTVIGTGGTPRLGFLTSFDSGCFTALGPSAPGDSGAPMLEVLPTTTDAAGLCTGGKAVGILTHELAVVGLIPTSIIVGTPATVVAAALDDGEILP